MFTLLRPQKEVYIVHVCAPIFMGVWHKCTFMGARAAERETADQQRLSGPKDIISHALFYWLAFNKLSECTLVELGGVEPLS